MGSPVTSGELIRNLVSAHSKYLCIHLFLIYHFEVGVSVTADFPVNWSQCRRPWKHPIFSKETSRRASPSFDDRHLKVFFAQATTSFNFSVLSVLNGGDAQKANPSSDSKSYLMAAWARLKKVVWCCHKHASGVKSNSVSSTPSSISKIFSFSISSQHSDMWWCYRMM